MSRNNNRVRKVSSAIPGGLSVAVATIAPGLLTDALGDMLRTMLDVDRVQRLRDVLAAVLPLDGAEPAQPDEEMQGFLKQHGNQLGMMLKVYSKMLQASSFNSRVMRYARDPDEPERGWKFAGVYNAAPVLMEGELFVLDRMMDDLRERIEERSLTIWLHSLAIGDFSLYLAYVRRDDVPPCVYLIKDMHWAYIGMPEDKTKPLLEAAMTPPGPDKRAWEGFMKEQRRWMEENHREPVQAHLTELGLAQPLTDTQWQDLVQLLYANRHSVRLFQEASRDMGRDTLLEAHALLHIVTEKLDEQLTALTEKREELDRELDRRTKRMRTDLERAEMLSKGSQARAARVEQENRELLARLNERPGHPGGTGPAPVPLGLAVDALF